MAISLDIVKKYLAKQISVIPLKPNSKLPNLGSWKRYQTQPMTAEEAGAFDWSNIAIVTGKISNNLVVFDGDNDESVRLLNNIPVLSETMQVKTRRGIHFYVMVDHVPFDTSLPNKSISSDKIHIDVKADGGYVVAPPSEIDGHIYTLVDSSKNAIKHISYSELLDIIKTLEQQVGKNGVKPLSHRIVIEDRSEYLGAFREFISQYYKKGLRQTLSLYIAGYLLKDCQYSPAEVQNVIIRLENNTDSQSSELTQRLSSVDTTVKKLAEGKADRIKGYQGLLEVLGEKIKEMPLLYQEHALFYFAYSKPTLQLLMEAIGFLLNRSKAAIYHDDCKNVIVYEANGKQEKITNGIIYTLQRELENLLNRTLEAKRVQQAIVAYAEEHKRNTLVEYLEACYKKWDGKSRIPTFFESAFNIPTDTYHSDVAKYFFCSAVARAYNPGIFVKYVLTLIGPQNIGKSTAFRTLADKWFAEVHTNISEGKDFYLSIANAWIVELAEMYSLKKADRNRVKAIISTPIDVYRKPYDIAAQEVPRKCIFVCTTNDSDIYTDPTGGTRFMPVHVQTVNLHWIEENRHHLFGEAVSLIKQNFNYWDVNLELFAEKQEIVRLTDEWEPVIEEYLHSKQLEFVQIRTIAEEVLSIPLEKLDFHITNRIADILKALKWNKKKKKVFGNVTTVYTPPADFYKDAPPADGLSLELIDRLLNANN